MPVSTDDFDLVTSLRYDPKLLTSDFNTQVNGIELPYLLFVYHVDRLLAAANAFQWPYARQALTAPDAAARIRYACDDAVMHCPLTDKEKGLGLRVLLSSSGDLRVEAHPTRPLIKDPLFAARINPMTTSPDRLPPTILSVHIDTQPTSPSLFTAHKTTQRHLYNAARARFGIVDRRSPHEVLLYNERREVTECSVRNVAFWRGEGWVTPPTRCGGLPGVVRRYLLEHGYIKEGIVKLSDVRIGEIVLLCNGWDGTILGRIVGD